MTVHKENASGQTTTRWWRKVLTVLSWNPTWTVFENGKFCWRRVK